MEDLKEEVKGMKNKSHINRIHHCCETKCDGSDISPLTNLILYLNSASNGDIINNSCSLEDLKNIKDLSLSGHQLMYFSEIFIPHLSNLKKLNLSNNNLTELPHTLGLLSNLDYLNIEDNQIESLPSSIGELSNLKLLCASGNAINELPESLGNLAGLVELNLHDNRLRDVPLSLAKLNCLKNLVLSKNRLKSLPRCVASGMIALETLDLSYHVGLKLSLKPFTKNLRRLYVKECGTVAFPTWLFTAKFAKLRELVLDKTRFAASNSIKVLPILHLRELHMVQCNISHVDLQEILKNTAELEKLDVGNDGTHFNCNVFHVMPIESLKNPEKLNEINVRNTSVPDVPAKIGEFANLIRIDIGQNNIHWLPDEICRLENLEVLLADQNSLHALPKEIGKMKGLKELKLSGNYLSVLPQSVVDLRCLEFLDLFENGFPKVPEEISKLTRLRGLDIDGNYFTTDDLWFRDVRYESLRNVIRECYYGNYDSRYTGPKVDESLDCYYENDSPDSVSTSLLEDDSRPETPDTNAMEGIIEENWNISEDSTDEFDPTVQHVIDLEWNPASKIFALREDSFYYAKLNKTNVEEVILDEGQFDDA